MAKKHKTSDVSEITFTLAAHAVRWVRVAALEINGRTAPGYEIYINGEHWGWSHRNANISNTVDILNRE